MSGLIKWLFGGGSKDEQPPDPATQALSDDEQEEEEMVQDNEFLEAQLDDLKENEVFAEFYQLEHPNTMKLVTGNWKLNVGNKECYPHKVAIVKTGAFQYYLEISDSSHFVLRQPITESMQLQFDAAQHAVVWYCPYSDQLMAFSIVFLYQQDEKTICDLLRVALYETTSKARFSDLSNDNQQWVQDAYVNESKTEASDDDDLDQLEYDVSNLAVLSQDEDMSGSDDDVDDDDDEEDHKHNSSTPARRHKTRNPNHNMAVGTANNRTFVFRGSQVEVYKHNDDSLKYLTRIPVVKALDGSAFSPQKAMLHQCDSQLLMLDPLRADTISCMDLETGKVVEEWRGTDDAVPIADMAPQSKYSQNTDTKLFVAVKNRALFTVDPRMPQLKKCASNFSYKSSSPSYDFHSVATTGSGNVVSGSATGELRLYTQVGQRAKTLLPGLGDAITSVDTTEDGLWILATTASYLLLVPTAMKNGKNGFTGRMGKEKPAPIKLQLHPRDLARYKIKEVKFTPARFNTGDNIREKHICTSVGPLIVVWNFRAVKLGRVWEYSMRNQQHDVVRDQFRFGTDQLVVALPDQVAVTQKSTK